MHAYIIILQINTPPHMLPTSPTSNLNIQFLLVTQTHPSLKSQADKTLASASGGFSFFGAREDKYQNAADLYIEAANAFRMQKMSACLPAS